MNGVDVMFVLLGLFALSIMGWVWLVDRRSSHKHRRP